MGLFTNKDKKIGGFTFTPERQAELKEKREFLLDEYDYIGASKLWKKTKKRVIKVVDGFSDIREILAFYKLKSENVVAILGHKGIYSSDLNEVPIFPKDIAGVFCIHEKKREVSFPDGISYDTVLYNVKMLEHNLYYHCNSGDMSNLFYNIPSKEKLIKALFGKEQRTSNQKIENFLLSLDVVEKDSLYFYLATKATKEVREKIFSFSDEYLKLKQAVMKDGKYYPSVPDIVEGGSFDFEKAEKDSKEGVEIKFFHGHSVYEKLAEDNAELKYILNLEKERIKFISQFPGLEDELFDNALGTSFGELAIYGYSSFDRAHYGSNADFEIRGLKDKDRDSPWSELFTELEKLFEGKLPEKYCGSVDEKKKAKTKRENEVFLKVTKEMISGLASENNEVISYVNMRSSKPIPEQFERDTTFSFVDIPFIEAQNYEVKGALYKTIHSIFTEVANEELKKDFIKSTEYITI